MDIKQSKSILAKLLATEDISVQHKNIPTAYFDLKNRVLALPTWKEMGPDLYDLLTGHEVGHALFTPESGWHDAVTDSTDPGTFKGFLNVLEDARIEKLIKRKFPGLAKNFYAAYKQLFDMNFFEVEDADIPELLFIDRINIHFKMGAFYAVPFSPAEQELVREVEKLETWEQVHELAKRLYGLAEDELKDKQMQSKVYMPGDADGDDDDGESIEMQLTDEQFDELSHKFKQMKSPESLTDKAFRNREKELLDEKAKPHFYFNLGEFDSSKYIWKYKDMLSMLEYTPKQESMRGALFQEFRVRNSKFISYLIKEFELRRNAQQLARARVTKSGEIDMKKLHQFNFSEDLFLKVTNVPKGKNHGLIMYYDMSGSMSHYMGAVIEQMLILVEFCRKVNIPFEVYGFTNNFARLNGVAWDDRFQDRIPATMNENDILMGDNSFRLQQYFSDQMSANEYKRQLSNLLLTKRAWESYYNRNVRDVYESSMPNCEQLHSTPLNQTVILSRDIFERFKARTKAEIVNMVYLTDGEADNSLKYFDGRHEDHMPSSTQSTIYIKDKKSRVEAKVTEGHNHKGYTTALLELVRGRTGANIVGFFLASSPRRAVENCIIGDRWNRMIKPEHEAEIERIMAGYKKDKVAVVTQAGFNEYYVVHTDSLDIDEDDEIAGENIRDISRNFRKMHKGKLVNRVLLNRFIGMIA